MIGNRREEDQADLWLRELRSLVIWVLFFCKILNTDTHFI